MSTWHQDRAEARKREAGLTSDYAHKELWTVVEDGPNKLKCVSRFKDPVEAQRYLERIKETHAWSYMVPPTFLH